MLKYSIFGVYLTAATASAVSSCVVYIIYFILQGYAKVNLSFDFFRIKNKHFFF